MVVLFKMVCECDSIVEDNKSWWSSWRSDDRFDMAARLLGQLVGGWAGSRGFLSTREFRLFASRQGAIAPVTLAASFRTTIDGSSAVLDVPTVGMTDDPLLATGDEPGPAWMAKGPAPARRRGGRVSRPDAQGCETRRRARRMTHVRGGRGGDRSRKHGARPLAGADARSAPARTRAARCEDVAAAV